LKLLKQNPKASTFRTVIEKKKFHLLEKTRPYGEDDRCELYKASTSCDSGR